MERETVSDEELLGWLADNEILRLWADREYPSREVFVREQRAYLVRLIHRATGRNVR